MVKHQTNMNGETTKKRHDLLHFYPQQAPCCVSHIFDQGKSNSHRQKHPSSACLFQMAQQEINQMIVRTSIDYERGAGQKFIKAQGAAIKLLDEKLPEKHKVCFFQNAMHRITFKNDTPMGTHTSGQLAYLPWEPTRDDVLSGRPIEMMVAPLGCTHEPRSQETEATLQQLGWNRMPIGIAPDRSIYANGMRVCRTQQYGLYLISKTRNESCAES